MKKVYNVFHEYDVDGGFGDAISRSDLVGTVVATEEEIKAFVEKWDKPEVYEKPYASLYHHGISVEEVEIVSVNEFEPYDKDAEEYWYF